MKLTTEFFNGAGGEVVAGLLGTFEDGALERCFRLCCGSTPSRRIGFGGEDEL
jgi:hypothetical protein